MSSSLPVAFISLKLCKTDSMDGCSQCVLGGTGLSQALRKKRK